jgi:hypothetical protein
MKEFSFSNVAFQDLKFLHAKPVRNIERFKEWFNKDIQISETDLEFLKKLNAKYGEDKTDFFRQSSEDTIKVKFIAPILEQVDFFSPEKNISSFYNEKLKYVGKDFILQGYCDFYVAKGEFVPEELYFFIQEFKRGSGTDPLPQLVAELIAGLEISNLKEIKGAFIIGSIWNFVILEKNIDSYQYYVSKNFDATKIDDLKSIFKNLLYLKNELFNDNFIL